MRILGPIVLAQAPLVASRQSDFGLCRAVRAQLVGNQNIRREALFIEQRAHQFHGCNLVASSLHQQVENLAFVVNRAPQPELPARNRHSHLIEMPCMDAPARARWFRMVWSRDRVRSCIRPVLSHQLDSGGARFGRPAAPQAALAARHVRNASSRKTRSVRRDMRWRWTLNVFWTAA
jgi:hypothetical protein